MLGHETKQTQLNTTRERDGPRQDTTTGGVFDASTAEDCEACDELTKIVIFLMLVILY